MPNSLPPLFLLVATLCSTFDMARAQDTPTIEAVPTNRPSQTAAPVGPGTKDVVGAVSDRPVSIPETGIQNPITRLGIFTLTPAVTDASFYDDNVFATSASRRSDVVFVTRPEISAAAGGGDYGILANAFVEGRKYATYSSESQINGGASAAGVYQPDASTQIKSQVEYLHGHEDRGLGESAFIVLDRPVAFNQVDGAIALNKRFDRYWASVGGSALGVLYENDSLQGAPIDETYRNVAIPTITGRVGYVAAPLTSVFGEVTGNAREFQYEPLSSIGYRAVAGLLFEPGPGARIKGEVFGGFMHQDYSGAGLQTIDTWTYGVAVSYLLTDYLTATLEGRREPKESPLFQGSLVQDQLGPTGGVSLIESSIGGHVDYQVLDNVVVSVGATYLDDAFKGLSEEDRYISPLASVNYTISRSVSIGVNYRRLEYRPDIVDVSGFQKDVVLASIHAAF